MSDCTKLLQHPLLQEGLLPLLTQTGMAFLVGGALRDTLLGRVVGDFDIATPTDPTALAQATAQRLGGRWFQLDAQRRQSRIVLTAAAGPQVTIDFAPFRAADLVGDLQLRDFTINALACDLVSGAFHDPFGGVQDLAAGLIRQCSPRSFDDDPLRVLRAVRLAQSLRFAIDQQTWKAALRAASPLSQVAAERRGDEVVQIVNAAGCFEACRHLVRLGTFPTLFAISADSLQPETFKANLCRLNELATYLAAERTQLAGLLPAETGRGLTRMGRLRLAALLHTTQPVTSGTLQERLALGRDNARALTLLSAMAAPGGSDMEGVADTPRARALWAAQEPYPVDRLLFQAALAGERPLRDALLDALAAYLAVQVDGRVPDLVDGNQLARKSGVSPGPQLGKLLESLREAERVGEVKTPADALRFVAARQKKSVDNKNPGPL